MSLCCEVTSSFSSVTLLPSSLEGVIHQYLLFWGMHGASFGIFNVACPAVSAYNILPAEFRPNSTIRDILNYDVISIFQDGGQGIAIPLPVLVLVSALIWESRNIPAYQISARYLKRPICWNFTSDFSFRVCVTIGTSFCICLPNIVQIRPTMTELWRYIQYPRWRPQHRNSTSGFGFRELTHFLRSKSKGCHYSMIYDPMIQSMIQWFSHVILPKQ